MPSLLSLTAPLALILPLLGQGSTPYYGGLQDAQLGSEEPHAPTSAAPDYDTPPEGPSSRVDAAPRLEASPLDAFYGGQVNRQVRIEQRVIIRISPQRQSNRNELLAQLPQRGLNTRFEEREMERCLPVNRISGVQTGTGNRLLLFMRDQRIISINLERACRAREFYSGFYVERSDDGQLCVDRDALQSRSGAKCDIERMSQLVAVTE
ncbi:hypothetical protein [uncultured Erythrobacter sp.]|uniref:hypothetical protein n=1 Tax=uncultured Erythrobacter sp. TaxID=263913 RepID=UPI0026174A02|nr:hypothetical protein [uncultured Erythrobacter sp.]